MKNRLFKLMMLAIALLPLTGCWDATEISDHKLITLLGVDRTENGIKFLLEHKLPVRKASADKKGGSQASEVLTGDGENFVAGRNSYLRRISNDIFLGSTRAVVFSEDFAKKGVGEYLSRMKGWREYRKTISFFTTSTDMEKLFDAETLKVENVGLAIENLSSNLSAKGLDYNATVARIMECLMVPNTGFIINNMEVINNSIEVTGYSTFKNDKKIGFIPISAMKGVNYIVLDNADGEYQIDFEGTSLAISTSLLDKKIRANYADKKISFDIKISIKGEILSTTKDIKLDKEKMKQIELIVSGIAKKDITEAITTSQADDGADYLSFYEYFRARYNSDFKKMDWGEAYKDAKFNIKVDAKVTPANMINFE